MRTSPLAFSLPGAVLMFAGAVSAHAAVGTYYDPSNAASPTGNTIGYELFRTIGCPGQPLFGAPCAVPEAIDSDRDGVPDVKDKCPNTPTGRKVNAEGCEPDRDGDGIVDGEDACPDVHAKTKNGCPAEAPALAATAQPDPAYVAEPAKDPAPIPGQLVLKGVNFEYNKATLTQADHTIIDQNVADLKNWEDVIIVISGHTDSRGSEKYNLDLSLRRAQAVRDYLISQGIPANRLIARGYGEAKPIADNNTKEGRHTNRRVELMQINR